jgi:hypothetical protein
MEERDLTRLLQQLGDRTTPSAPPLERIMDAGAALRGRRRGSRMRVLAVAAAAAAVIGGGAVAATVLDLPTSGSDASSDAGQAEGAVDDSGAGGESGSDSNAGRETDEGAVAADAAAPVVVTPDLLQPGDTFRLTSRDPDAGFGLAWDLQRFTDDGVTPAYVLAAAFHGGDPQWWAEGESWAVEAPLVSAPLAFVLPPDAPAGDYLLCEHDDPEVCASLTVGG